MRIANCRTERGRFPKSGRGRTASKPETWPRCSIMQRKNQVQQQLHATLAIEFTTLSSTTSSVEERPRDATWNIDEEAGEHEIGAHPVNLCYFPIRSPSSPGSNEHFAKHFAGWCIANRVFATALKRTDANLWNLLTVEGWRRSGT